LAHLLGQAGQGGSGPGVKIGEKFSAHGVVGEGQWEREGGGRAAKHEGGINRWARVLLLLLNLLCQCKSLKWCSLLLLLSLLGRRLWRLLLAKESLVQSKL
jgi:hypothetical protein